MGCIVHLSSLVTDYAVWPGCYTRNLMKNYLLHYYIPSRKMSENCFLLKLHGIFPSLFQQIMLTYIIMYIMHQFNDAWWHIIHQEPGWSWAQIVHCHLFHILTTSGATSDENFIKMMTFLFQFWCQTIAEFLQNAWEHTSVKFESKVFTIFQIKAFYKCCLQNVSHFASGC